MATKFCELQANGNKVKKEKTTLLVLRPVKSKFCFPFSFLGLMWYHLARTVPIDPCSRITHYLLPCLEDLKSRLASQEAELQLRNQDAEALIAKIGFQTEKVRQEGAIAAAEEQKVSLIPPVSAVELYLAQNKPF